MSSTAADTTIRKTARKKAVRHVPSRYMQAAQVSKSSSAESTSVNTTISTHSNETLDVSQATWTQQGNNSGNQLASTPNSSDGGFSIPLHEASLIAGNTAHSAPVCKEHLITATALKQRLKFQSEPDNIRPSHIPTPAVPASKTGKEKTGARIYGPDRVQEIEVKNIYAMHVQAAFLESRAQKSFHIRTQNALEQFYKVYCVIQILMQKLQSVEDDLLFVSHLRLIQQLLKPQEDILEAVSHDMPALFECYCDISKATDFVRSNLPLSDVHVAADSNLRADLSCLLAKCEAQLESFFKSHSSEMTESSNISKLFLKIKSCVGDLGKETCKLNDLLLAVDEMAVTKSSLEIGEIMSTVGNNYTT